MNITLNKKEKEFVTAYFEAMHWTEECDDKLCEDFEREQIIECLAFYVSVECYLSDGNRSQAGHDFWLSRNEHGTGFWDRESDGCYKPQVADLLQRKCDWFGMVDVIFENGGPYYD